MAKKVTLEVDAETSKAQRKIKQLADDGGSVPPNDGGDKAAQAMTKLAKATKDFAENSDRSAATMVRLAKSFAGMAAGMAASYAANYMDPGVGRTTMGYVGAIASGASAGAATGMMLGPKGAAAGAVIGGAAGGIKTFMDHSKSEDDWFKAFGEGEERLAATREWAAKLDEMTSVKTRFNGLTGVEKLKAQLQEVDAASERTADAVKILKSAEQDSVNVIKGLEKSNLTADEKIAKGGKESEELAFTRQKLAQLEGAAKRLENMRESLMEVIESNPARDFRASLSALDSLARIGGGAGRSDGWRDLARLNEREIAVLEKIEAKTGKGAGTF